MTHRRVALRRSRRASGAPAGACAGACAAILALAAGPAAARDATVVSFDATPIVVHFYPPVTAPPGGVAPTMIIGPTYPSPGDIRADEDFGDRIGIATLRREGYNVLTFDPRGLGGSGGAVNFDSPAFEGRDARAIVDFVAAQPEAQLDAPGDPRVGMSGTSYGAGIQYVTAGLDARVDAIIPDIGWHSLVSSLYRNGAVKTGWLAPLCGLDVVAGAVDGKASAADVRPVTASAALKAACVEGVAGRLSSASRTWLAGNGPGALVDRIRAPMLITQGTWDTLFGLDEAVANFEALRRRGVPAKMIWYCGGHVDCPVNAGDPRHLARAGLAWLHRWLRGDAAIDTGPAFEWQADDDVTWRAGPDFPLASAGTLDAVGTGSLKIGAADTPQRGLGRASVPARNAVEARFPALPGAADVLGAPRVRLVYRGRATPARTHLYAQVVDAVAKRVAGGQATPLPVILDGRERSVSLALESIALRGARSSSYRLQVTPGAATYQQQRSTGRVSIYGATGSLPLADAGRSGRGAVLRTAARPRLSVSTRRNGARARLRLRASLPAAQPCRGTITFTVRTPRRPYFFNAPLRDRPCRGARTVHVPAQPGSLVRVSATFNGNQALTARRGQAVSRRIR